MPMICCKVCQEYSPAEDVQCVHCGAPLPKPKWLDSSLGMEQQIRLMLAEGYKIGAIKLYRDQTGVSLKQAKDAVDAIEQGQPYERPGEIGQDLERELTGLLQDGKKIEAIKLFREQTGAGLKDAKDAVEAFERGLPIGLPGQLDERFERELSELLQAGKKIEAIKRFREQTGTGLKQAKDAVEHFAARRGIASPRGSGCLNVLLLTAAVIVEILLA